MIARAAAFGDFVSDVVTAIGQTLCVRSTADWRRCPGCHQSATGRYNGKLACVRCHWLAEPVLPAAPAEVSA